MVEVAFKFIGVNIEWRGEGLNEQGFSGDRVYVKINPKFYRPMDVTNLLADPTKARKILDLSILTPFEELIKIMFEDEVKNLKK
mmetsp:Transcript_92933/g.129007  ORF Transcript_92933/g.129007 Transcript_92933/m.129007 type:complete len:84 (+) Transcript_92933:154-405(+)